MCIRSGNATAKASGFILFGQAASTAIPWFPVLEALDSSVPSLGSSLRH